MTSTQLAENYHLKWDSHSTYMNLSLGNLFKNEKFADVMLLTSNPDGGPPIPAHKIILTLCSSYFASIFDMNPSITTATNGIIYIVLPSELSRRAIKILVQYMYSGETTVSNDILNEVLRGGEILRIRGLYRSNNNNNSSNNGNMTITSNHIQRSYSSDSNSSHHHHHQYATRKPISDIVSNIQQTKQSDSELRNQILSNSNLLLVSTTLPKESPVIVRSPKPPPLSSTSSSSSKIHHQSISSNTCGPPVVMPQPMTQNISIRKDVAIDPDECHSTSKYYRQHHQQQMSSNHFPNSSLLNNELQEHCGETICRNYSSSTLEPSPLATEIDRIRPNSEDMCQRCPRSEHEEFPDYQQQRRNSRDNESSSPPLRNFVRRVSLPESSRSLLGKTKNSNFVNENSNDSECGIKLPTVKEEPNDWTTDQRSNSPTMMKKQTTTSFLPLNVIKTESDHSGGEDQNTDKENEDDLSYSPLTCELCSETFTVPKDWVRHIESHMDSTSTHILPKKKRKVPQQPDSDFLATLKCDLCSTYFTTPAEWVRHIQNSHTETELAMCNVEHSSTSSSMQQQQQQKLETAPPSSTVKKKRSCVRSDYELYLGKTCAICNKKFPSYASMVIHSRSHSSKLS